MLTAFSSSMPFSLRIRTTVSRTWRMALRAMSAMMMV
jgi:hypothetical protein